MFFFFSRFIFLLLTNFYRVLIQTTDDNEEQGHNTSNHYCGVNDHEGDEHDTDMDRDRVGEWDSEEGTAARDDRSRTHVPGRKSEWRSLTGMQHNSSKWTNQFSTSRMSGRTCIVYDICQTR